MKRFFLMALMMMMVVAGMMASPRIKFSINDNWRFMRQAVADAGNVQHDDSQWRLVNLPHTWNAEDVMDDVPGYYRDEAWYRRWVHVPADFAGKQITILFEGANQEVEMYVNGRRVGGHVGGYTRFSFDLTPYLEAGKRNLLAVKVNNRYNEMIPPLTADFTFFGGIYRDVYLIATSPQHVSTTHYASEGVYIATPEVSSQQAKVEVATMLTNASPKESRVSVDTP